VQIEFECTANVESVTAVFLREDESQWRITLHDDVTPLTPEDAAEDVKHRVRSKKFHAELVTLVDVDHSPGVYRLDRLLLKIADGGDIPIAGPPYGAIKEDVRFEIHGGYHNIERIQIRLTDPPDYQEEE
jgi:hypothetical protein